MAASLSGPAAEIREGAVFRSFLACLAEYGITKFFDFHAHVSSGREAAPWATEADVRELPSQSLGPSDIVAFYRLLMGEAGIKVGVAVFETPLHGYDLAAKNLHLLREVQAGRKYRDCKLFPFAVMTPQSTPAEIESYLAGGARGFKVSPRTAPSYYLAPQRSPANDYYREVKAGQGLECEAPPSVVYGLPVFSTA